MNISTLLNFWSDCMFMMMLTDFFILFGILLPCCINMIREALVSDSAQSTVKSVFLLDHLLDMLLWMKAV